MYKNKRGSANLLLIVVAVGFLAFLLISASLSFKNKFFGSLFSKPASFAVSAPISGPINPGATLALSPANASFIKGCSYSLDVKINTGGVQTVGTDAILNFDPNIITVNSVTGSNIYPDYPSLSFNNTSGQIFISGISAAPPTPGFSGTGVFATIKFQIKTSSTLNNTVINFDFNPNNLQNTTDSNIIDISSKDFLVSVTNGNYSLTSGTCTKTGDINGDSKVNVIDLSILLSNFNKTTADPTFNTNVDLNKDGKVTIIDLSILLTNWG